LEKENNRFGRVACLVFVLTQPSVVLPVRLLAKVGFNGGLCVAFRLLGGSVGDVNLKRKTVDSLTAKESRKI
jgi:hypothetical protein